jgi:hypothetical protein
VWLYFEIQMGKISADQYSRYLDDLFPGRFHMYRGVKGEPRQVGVPVTEDMKLGWSDAILEVMVGQSLWYAADFVTSQTGDLTLEMSEKLVKEKLEDQINRWTCKIKLPTDPFGKVKRTFGAKDGGMDDLCSCLAAVLLQMKNRLKDQTYRNWCSANNIQRI